jgi:hypothetical protein
MTVRGVFSRHFRNSVMVDLTAAKSIVTEALADIGTRILYLFIYLIPFNVRQPRYENKNINSSMASSVQHYFRISGITMGWTELLVGAFTALFICTGLIVRYLYETKNIVSTIPLSEHYFRISGIPALWTEVDVVDGLKSLERARIHDDQHPRPISLSGLQ